MFSKAGSTTQSATHYKTGSGQPIFGPHMPGAYKLDVSWASVRLKMMKNDKIWMHRKRMYLSWASVRPLWHHAHSSHHFKHSEYYHALHRYHHVVHIPSIRHIVHTHACIMHTYIISCTLYHIMHYAHCIISCTITPSHFTKRAYTTAQKIPHTKINKNTTYTESV